MPLLAGGNALTATLVFPTALARARLIPPEFYAAPKLARLPQVRPAGYAETVINGLLGLIPAMPAIRFRRTPQSIAEEHDEGTR
jgi:hypothetical protein